MKHLACALSPLLALLTLTGPTYADALDTARVPAGVHWLVHVDVEAATSSALFKAVLGHSGGDGEFAEFCIELDGKLEEVRSEFGFDPLKDVLSVTLFGRAHGAEEPSALIQTKVDVAALIDGLSSKLECVRSQIGEHAIYDFDEGEGFAYVLRSSAANGRWVLLSPSRERLLEGIEVLEGRQQSLATAESPAITARPAPHSMLFIAAGPGLDKLGEHDAPPVSAVAKLARSVVIDVCEQSGMLSASFALEALDYESAQKIAQVLQGAVALIGLAGAQHDLPPAIEEFARTLRFETRNETVLASFRYDSARLIQELDELEREY